MVCILKYVKLIIKSAEDNCPHVVMEMCEGGDLERAVARQKNIHFPTGTVRITTLSYKHSIKSLRIYIY